jgi:hypothetical protein
VKPKAKVTSYQEKEQHQKERTRAITKIIEGEQKGVGNTKIKDQIQGEAER